MKLARVLAAAAVVAAPLAVAAPASAAVPAQFGTEEIRSYAVELVVDKSGTLHVNEDIVYDFGVAQRHGIERRILVKTPYDQGNDLERVFPVHDIHVATRGDTPGGVSTRDEGNEKIVRIGDPDRTITGAHEYLISYEVDGAMQSFDDHDELYWNAIGPAWDVPILTAAILVRGPAAVTRIGCFAGPVGSRAECTRSTVRDNGAAAFAQDGMSPHDVFTVVAAFPSGTVPRAEPILKERQTLRRAFSTTPATLSATGIVFLGLLGWLGWVFWTRGRDRRYLGQVPGLEPAKGQRVADEPVPIFDGTPVSVEFAPPDNVRPGEVGTLLDEQANPLDVTATIIDLAVRGFLAIEQLREEHWYRSGDWQLTKLDKPTDELASYESALYTALFKSGTIVTISSLKDTFATDLHSVQDKLYNDVVQKGWFRRRPDIVRSQWFGVSLAVIGAGIVATFLLGKNTRYGLVGVAVVIAGIFVFAFHNAMPAKTARGSAMLARIAAFRRYLETAEAEQLRFEEKADVFAKYLPFAIVFGVTEKWAKAFERLAAAQPAAATSAMAWYGGPPGWNVGYLAGSLTHFTTATSGIIASTPTSTGGLGGGAGSGFGGGGFSGGGGGGGGGGSW